MDCKSGPAVTLNSTSITKRMFSPLHAPVPFVSFHSFRALPGLFPSGGVNHVQDRFPCIPCRRKQRFHSSQGALVTLSAIRARNLSASLFFVFTAGRQKMFSGIKTHPLLRRIPAADSCIPKSTGGMAEFKIGFSSFGPPGVDGKASPPEY